MGYDKVQKAFERNAIEIAPLAFMRGRTLNNAFVILDEAQNTTPEQMKMFLTRIGFGAKAVVTGDVSQIDLPKGQLSGLIDAERVLRRVKGIAMTRFTSADVVRHPLVARIVDAYDAQRTTVRSRSIDA
jgi:phosphate starvation-inducible PhoH-like protein